MDPLMWQTLQLCSVVEATGSLPDLIFKARFLI
jgi:hypothetical protein